MKKILIANRGEIAIRIARAAAECQRSSVAIYAPDDARSLHVKAADEAIALTGQGAAAYLDADQIIAIALSVGADAIHPGYGFLSENADFANQCAQNGITFIGPNAKALDVFGDKVKARALAADVGVPLLPGTNGPTSLAETRTFFTSLGDNAAIMIKAVAGGGGRGMRPVTSLDDIDEAYERCQSEAAAAFGIGDVYVEQLITKARHIEIQIVGDGNTVIHLGERECSLQRRHQKLVEVAPSPTLAPALRDKLTQAALKLAQATQYNSLGTFEFLIDAQGGADASFAFMEANPRLQVEHTVTEEITSIDLVATQIHIAAGQSLRDLGLSQESYQPRGHAVQIRINMETMDAQGEAKPAGGILKRFTAPSGPGIRVDSFGYQGYQTSPNYDSLLAKLIAWSPSANYTDAVNRAYRAACEFQIEGVATNLPFHLNLLKRSDFQANDVYTNFIADHAVELVGQASHSNHFFEEEGDGQATGQAAAMEGPAGTSSVPAPMQGRVISVDVAEGDEVALGQQVAVIEAMKMEHTITANISGIVRQVNAAPDDVLFEGTSLFFMEEREVAPDASLQEEEVDLDHIRPDLQEVIDRVNTGLDEHRPDAVARRRKRNQRTTRENIADLCDEDSFIEYGGMALAAQRRRRSMEDLIKMSPADGMVTGIGSVNGDMFEDVDSRAMVLAYDFTVFAGTQGGMNHKKTDRMLDVAEEWNLPIVLFAEGGGGRPGDTDIPAVAGLDTPSFIRLAQMNGRVPLVGVVSGRCFAGNAALLGCCDTIIAAEDSNIGMGGPAMIEGGGLGVYSADEVGPIDVHRKNGVVDIVVKDEAEAVAATKKYLSYFQGPVENWTAEDQRILRSLIPENRLRAYDVRTVIDNLCDVDSVLELRKDFGIGILTCLVRIEGRPMGLIANNPYHLGGAIDAPAADKAARFMQLCNTFGLPMVSLCDTPGFMVGPDIEETAQVRHVSRMFINAAHMKVPFFTVVLRKGYGLGAQGMAAGSFHKPFFNISWPTGEFGGMGLEGAVRLGFKKEMEAIEDLDERDAFYQKMVDAMYEKGKAINMASFLEIDGVIDPEQTRHWLVRGLKSVPETKRTANTPPGFIDAW
ncbi:MAG: carboxyl transferase domain-containing protein [Parvibaculaceae bacterium]|nr:carboxyl transferase domain-containing protein [Parvibaculaceae bacterium]